MTTAVDVNGMGLEKAFDVLLDQNQRIMRENELLRGELLRHPSGALQVRAVERSLGLAYRQIDYAESRGIVSR